MRRVPNDTWPIVYHLFGFITEKSAKSVFAALKTLNLTEN